MLWLFLFMFRFVLVSPSFFAFPSPISQKFPALRAGFWLVASVSQNAFWFRDLVQSGGRTDAKCTTVRGRKIRLTKICSFFFVLLLRPESNCFLGRGYGGVDTARRRWRFDTSIFRISKVDPSTNTLAMGTNMFRDPFLDQFFGNFLNFWKPPNWRSWRHDRNKSAIWGFFGDNSQCIYDQCILCFWPFLNNQLRFALLPCTVYLVYRKWWYNETVFVNHVTFFSAKSSNTSTSSVER